MNSITITSLVFMQVTLAASRLRQRREEKTGEEKRRQVCLCRYRLLSSSLVSLCRSLLLLSCLVSSFLSWLLFFPLLSSALLLSSLLLFSVSFLCFPFEERRERQRQTGEKRREEKTGKNKERAEERRGGGSGRDRQDKRNEKRRED